MLSTIILSIAYIGTIFFIVLFFMQYNHKFCNYLKKHIIIRSIIMTITLIGTLLFIFMIK